MAGVRYMRSFSLSTVGRGYSNAYVLHQIPMEFQCLRE